MHHNPIAGSNTHNNGNPAGDGQTGDDGEGKAGKFLVLKFGTGISSLSTICNTLCIFLMHCSEVNVGKLQYFLPGLTQTGLYNHRK